MRSPLDHIGRRTKRSPFGTDLHIYRPPKPKRSMRAKLVLAGFMAAATIATGLFIQIRLAQKPDSLIALEPAAEPAPAAAAEASPAEQQVASVPVKPTMVRTVAIPAPQDSADGVDPGTLGHDDPRWGRAKLEAAAAAKAKAAQGAGTQAAAEGDTPLAFATADGAEGDQKQDRELTAAIPPPVILPKPVVDNEPASTDPNQQEAARTVRIARAVNLRASPRSGSRVIKVLPAGANVGLFSCDGWCEVSYQGARGFIYKSFVQGGGSAAKARPAAEKTAEPKRTTLIKLRSDR